MPGPERRNHEEIDRLQHVLTELRAHRSSTRKTEAVREGGLEIAVGVREVGALLVDVGWEQSHAADGSAET